MTHPPEADEFQAKLRRLDLLVRQFEQLPDPAARAHARELVQALLDLHATGLDRLLDHVAAAGAAGDAVIDACAADDVVGGLLLLHGLHPLGLEDRVRQALDQVRPHLRSHGGAVELLGVDDGIVQLRIERAGEGGSSSAEAMRRAVEEAIFAKAPDVAGVEIEGLGPMPAADGRVALPLV